MSEILFIGWEHSEPSTDKIWGIIQLDDNNIFTFWGKRPTLERTPNSIQLKRWVDETSGYRYHNHTVDPIWNDNRRKFKFNELKKVYEKKKKRYIKIDQANYESICPGLVEYMNQMMLMQKLMI